MVKLMMSENINAINLAALDQYVATLKQAMKRQYDRSINKDLSQQHWQGLFKRNVTLVLKQAYEEALTQLQQLSVDAEQAETEQVAPLLSGGILQSFEGFNDELIQYALHKHRTSCALSNFPDEHNPSRDYIAEVLQETNQDWQVFVEHVNAVPGG